MPEKARGLDRLRLERILVVQLGKVGDVLLCTPILRALRARFPDARIAFLTRRPCADLLRGNPHLDEILEAGSFPGTLREILSRDFTLALDLQRSHFSSLLLGTAGLPLRLGRPVGGLRDALMTHLVPAQRAYSAHFRASILRVLGIEELSLDLDLIVPDDLLAWARAWREALGPGGPLVAFSPWASAPTRALLPLDQARVVRLLSASLGVRMVILWGPGEEGAARALAAETGMPCAPPTDLPALVALISACDALVGACSGPRHIAVARRVPTLVAHGASAVGGWTRPTPWHRALWRELDCRPCNRDRCDRGLACLTDLDPASFVEPLRELLTLGAEPTLRVRILPS
jgi:ADP-heptose:LPS heptosyltransferase